MECPEPRDHELAALAEKLRGSVGLAYISERAVYAFIHDYDAIATGSAEGQAAEETK